MRYFPVFFDVEGHAIAIIGDGEKAVQKLRLIAKSEARIKVLSLHPSPDLRDLASSLGVEILTAPFEPHHLDGVRLTFVASDDATLVRRVAHKASCRNIPLNVVDQPEQSTFIVPAIVDRDPIIVAVGSEGTAPVLAREVRSRIEAMLPARLGAVAKAAARLRTRLKAAVAEPALRRRVWERLLLGLWRDRVLARDEAGAAAILEREISAATGLAEAAGRVSLVGAGPGDPDLLTLRAQQRLQEADVIVVDGLVPDAILEHTRRDAHLIRVGKEGYGEATGQDEINAILVREAAKGLKVVRLKGGDPFIFGRAAEELAAVRAAGIEVDVVPGVTTAHACAAAIGLPLTLREKVRQFSVVTGATAAGLPDLDWECLAQPGHAFAIYMGIRTAPAIAVRLMAQGAKPTLPVVVVENGTRPEERVLRTTLGGLRDALMTHTIRGPAIIYVGLDWEMAHLSAPARVKDALPSIAEADACTSWRPAAAQPIAPAPQPLAG